MKKVIVLIVLAVALLSASIAFAGGNTNPPSEGSAKEGTFYVARTISEQYPGLSGKYLKKYGTAYFFAAGKDKTKFELNLVEGDTVVHVALKRVNIAVICDDKYSKCPLVKLTLDETGKVVSATVFTTSKTRLFAPSPGPQG